MSKAKFIVYKYIDPDTEEHYLTITEQWDEIYDGPWYSKENKKVREIRIKREDNFLG